jgi:signal transduction histidine kinase
VSGRPRLTVRARLTLLNTGLFAVCGAIVVAVSYVLVSQLKVPGGAASTAKLHRFLARCPSGPVNPKLKAGLLVKCNTALQQLGAQQQRAITRAHLLEYGLITVAVVIVLAAALGWILSGRALRPVHRITAAARAASEHNLSARVGLDGPRDELSELADTFDAMLGRLQTAFENRSRFIANASHELRTPLAVMRATVDVVADNPHATAAEIEGMAADVRAAVDRSEQLIAALLILARNERGLRVHEQVDLATVVEDVLDAREPADRQLHLSLAPALISGDPVLTELLTANLVDNAVRYSGPGGEIWIGTETADGAALLTISNGGEVIDPADCERIFEPFERLGDRGANDGFGLGLAIVASIAAIHEGSVSAQPRAGGGLTITLAIGAAQAGDR